MHGFEIKLNDENGNFTISNKIADKISIKGKGEIFLNRENFKEIFNLMENHFENPNQGVSRY